MVLLRIYGAFFVSQEKLHALFSFNFSLFFYFFDQRFHFFLVLSCKCDELKLITVILLLSCNKPWIFYNIIKTWSRLTRANFSKILKSNREKGTENSSIYSKVTSSFLLEINCTRIVISVVINFCNIH